MTVYEIKAPDGKTYRIEGPKGATDDQVRQQVMAQFPEASGRRNLPEPKGDKATWAGAAKGVADAGLAVASNVAQRAVAVPKHLAEVASDVTRPLSRMSPENRAKEAATDAKPGFTEKMQNLLTYEAKTDEGKYLLERIKGALSPVTTVGDKLYSATERVAGKGVADVGSDLAFMAGGRGAAGKLPALPAGHGAAHLGAGLAAHLGHVRMYASITGNTRLAKSVETFDRAVSRAGYGTVPVAEATKTQTRQQKEDRKRLAPYLKEYGDSRDD